MAIDAYSPTVLVGWSSTVVTMVGALQSRLLHLTTLSVPAVSLWYAMTGKPSEPIAMEVCEPTTWPPAESGSRRMLPALQAALPQRTKPRRESPEVVIWNAITGRPSGGTAMDEWAPALTMPPP